MTRNERGAVGTIVAILFAGGLIFGMLAVAVDAGGLFMERRSLQNAADAASMSLAQSCASGNCEEDADGLQALVDANSIDGEHTVADQCGVDTPGTLPKGCDEGDLALTSCPPLPPSLPAGVPYVEVRTNSSTDGSPGVINWFASAAGGEASTTVTACARAAYGKPGAYTSTAPVTFSACEFAAMSGEVYDPPAGPTPGYNNSSPPIPAWPPASKEQGIILQSTGANPEPIAGCTTFNGHDAPGGFGYLEGEGCTAEITNDEWVGGQTGNNAKDCDISTFWKTAVDIPVFDCMKPGTSSKPEGAPSGDCETYVLPDKKKPKAGGENNWYHIVGWAKFYVSGYATGGKGQPSVLTGNKCNDYTGNPGNSDRCLMGWFVSGVLADAPLVGPPGGEDDFGTYAVVPAG